MDSNEYLTWFEGGDGCIGRYFEGKAGGGLSEGILNAWKGIGWRHGCQYRWGLQEDGL